MRKNYLILLVRACRELGLGFPPRSSRSQAAAEMVDLFRLSRFSILNVSVGLESDQFFVLLLAFAQDVQDQEEAREEDEAEQADPSLDPHAD